MGLQDILNRNRKNTVVFNNDDINVLNCNIEYLQDNKTLNYMIYELEILDDTGQLRHVYKAIKFVRIIRLPKSAKESSSLMKVHNQLLSAVWEKGINFIGLIANIIQPIPIGLMFCYGIQGVADNIEDAKHIANNDFSSLVALLQGAYAQLEFRLLNSEEVEWLRDKMYGMKHLTVVRGIPKAREGGVDLGNKGMGGSNLNPDSQETTEEFIRGLTDREYVMEVLITPVSRTVLENWLTQTAKEITRFSSIESGSKALSFNLSLPLMYGATLGSSSGWSHGYSDATSVGSATSESVSQSFSESVGSSHSVSQGQSVGYSQGISENAGINQGVSANQSLGESSNMGQNVGINHSDSQNASASQSHSEGESIGSSVSQGVSNSHSIGASESQGLSQSTSNSHSVNQSASTSQSVSDSSSVSKGSSASISDGVSKSNSFSLSNGKSVGSNWSLGGNASSGYGSGTNVGLGANMGVSGSFGSSDNSSSSFGASAGFGGSNGFSSSVSNGTSNGSSHSESFGTSSSVSNSHGTSSSVSNSFGEGWSTSNSVGQTSSIGKSESWGAGSSASVGQSQGASVSDSQSISKGQGSSDGWSKGLSYGNGVSASQSQGASSGSSYGAGRSEGISTSQSQSESWGTSQSFSKGTSTSQGLTNSQGRSQGVSQGTSGAMSQGLSASGGFGPSVGFSKSFNWVDMEVRNLLTMLNYNNSRLMRANTGDGAFFTDVYIATPDEETKSAVQSLAKSTWYAEESLIFPLQVMDLTPEEESHLLYHFNAFSSDNTKEGIPGKLESYRYTTVLLPLEVVAYTHLPRISEGGVYADVLDVPKFAVPSLKKGEIYIGKILSGERWSMRFGGYVTPFEYRLTGDEIMHGFFTGESRSGKTVCATRFIAEVANKVRRKDGKRFRIVAMDPKQDWRILAKFVEPERFKFFSLGKPDFLPINLNLWKIPNGVYPQQWIDGLIEIYCRAYGLAERGKSILAESIYALYDEAKVFEDAPADVISDRSKAVTFTSIYQRILSNKLALEDPTKSGKGRVGNDARDAYSRVLDRMQVFGRNFSIESKLFGRPDGLGVDDLIGGDDVVILESYGLESTFKNFVFGAITSGFFKYAQSREGGFKSPDQFETILIVEEANEVLIGSDTGSGGNSSGMGGQSEFEKILDQSAGLGLFIFSITQKIADMPTSVVANSGLVFAGKISRPDDVTTVIRKIGREERYDDRDLLKWFPRSPIGWFVCRSSRNFDFKDVEPCLVAVAPLSVDPPNNDELSHMMAIKEARLRQAEIQNQLNNNQNLNF